MTWLIALLIAITAAAALLLWRWRLRALRAATAAARALARGETGVAVAATGPPELRELVRTLGQLDTGLNQLTAVAEDLALGSLSVHAKPRSEADRLARALESTTRHLQEVVRVARRVSEGERIEMPVRSDRDQVGRALADLVRGLTTQLDDLTTGARRTRQLTDTLASARQRLEHLLASSPAMIYSRAASTYADFTFISANVTQLLGYSVEDFMAPGFWSARVHPDDRLRVEQELTRSRSGGETHLEYRFRHADGSTRWMRDGFRLMRNSAGEPAETVGWWIDVTDQKNTESALEQIESELRQAQKMEAIGTLAGGVAHDFNNLLTAIRGGAELLSESLAEPQLLEEVQEIQKAADRAAQLTRQLLAFSRKQVMRPQTLVLDQLVRGMEKMLQRLLLNDAITLRVEPADQPLHVFADPGQLEQVMLNLVVNARDAMPNGGTITVRVRSLTVAPDRPQRHTLQPGAYVVLEVEDTGCGMDEATQNRIFEPFFTTKPKDRGTGLGLSTVYGIVRQSGGDIVVRSAPGKGTLFSILLPHMTTTGEPRPAAVAAAPTSVRGSETILLVDDEDSVRSLVRKLLQRRGYQLLEASNGLQALDHVRNSATTIDLIITDLAMPGMTGRELAEQIHAIRPDSRFLFVSGYSYSETTLHQPGEEPSPAFLQKPFTGDELASRVRQLLDA